MVKTTSGFTIVELLIVIVVIAVLAAITTVAYNGIQNRTYETTVRSDLRMMAKKLAIYKLDSSNDRYPLGMSASLSPVDIKVSTSGYSTVANTNLTYYETDDGMDYALFATVKNGPVVYLKGSDTTIRTYTNSPQYPSGSPNVHATAMGFNLSNYDTYPVYVGNGGGWRIWN